MQNVLAEVMRDDDSRIVVLLAGSERRLMESLFSEGAPMEYLGTPTTFRRSAGRIGLQRCDGDS